eukprot:TRINITY_DN11102_c0_g2_i1.p2 TRINITY_DN11102_c0_g2~~TRINITY_DN11102_c0_g2_i1.p2  ORF type:complete len:187 (+),score=13.87 TRINITY_DN11102_c0_g2_i1:201-761(+)
MTTTHHPPPTEHLSSTHPLSANTHHPLPHPPTASGAAPGRAGCLCLSAMEHSLPPNDTSWAGGSRSAAAPRGAVGACLAGPTERSQTADSDLDLRQMLEREFSDLKTRLARMEEENTRLREQVTQLQAENTRLAAASRAPPAECHADAYEGAPDRKRPASPAPAPGAAGAGRRSKAARPNSAVDHS